MPSIPDNTVFLIAESLRINPLWYREASLGLEESARRRKCTITMATDVREIPNGVRSVVILGHSHSWIMKTITCLRNHNVKSVLIGGVPSSFGEDVSGIMYGAKTAVSEILKFFTKKGRTKIALAGIDYSNTVDLQKVQAFKDTCAMLGIASGSDDIYDITSEWRNIGCFFRRIGDYDAVICANDACGAFIVSACRKTGVKIPSRLSVCGMGDMLISNYTNPTLSTATRSFYKSGEKAFDIWRLLNQDEQRLSIVVTLPTEIRERQSTNPESSAISEESCQIQDINYYFDNSVCISEITRMRNLQHVLSSSDYIDVRILIEMLNGNSNERIAELLPLAPSTVAYRFKKLYETANINGKSELMKLFQDDIDLQKLKTDSAKARGIRTY